MVFKIDLKTGNLVFPDFTITRSMTMQQLKVLDTRCFKISFEHDIYQRCKVAIVEHSADRILISASLKAGVIQSISMFVLYNEYTTGQGEGWDRWVGEDPDPWSRWSEAEERKGLEKLLQILTQQGVRNDQVFPWGTVHGSYDPRSACAALGVFYKV